MFFAPRPKYFFRPRPASGRRAPFPCLAGTRGANVPALEEKMSPNPFRRRALAPPAALALTTVSLDARTQGRAGRRPSPPSDNSAQKSPPDPTRKDGPLPAAGSWRLKRTLRGHKGAVYSAAFYPKGTRVATSGDDGYVRVWDVRAGR